MRVPNVYLQPLLLMGLSMTAAAASWTFSDATVSVSSKGAGVGGGVKEKYAKGHCLCLGSC